MYSTPQNAVITSLGVDSSLADSASIVFKGFTKGVMLVPSGSSINTLTYYVSSTQGGTYIQLYNSSGAVSTTVAAGRAYPMPSEVEGAAFLKLVGNADGVVDLHLISS
tara:strand:+ start:857 stop:1180 length:324 start_codon:yes stop_codon:yes gene_type:complete